MFKYIAVSFFLVPLLSNATITNLICTHSITNTSIELTYDDASSVMKYKSVYADPKNFLYATDVVLQSASISFTIHFKSGDKQRMMLNRINGAMVIVGNEYRNVYSCEKLNEVNKLL